MALEIKTLKESSLEEIIDCLLDAFQNYFVQMPSDLSYWKSRFRAARVDLGLSVGAYEGNELVGFIIHGIGEYEGSYTAFNTGTGVIQSHRGQKLVDKMYEFIIPILKQIGVVQCRLDVITKNHKAIRTYERTGFNITNHYMCFKGTMNLSNIDASTNIESSEEQNIHHSWDNSDESLDMYASRELSKVIVQDKCNGKSTLIWITKSNQILQCERSQHVSWADVFKPLDQKDVKFINVPIERIGLVEFLLLAGLENMVDQYCMTRKI